MKRRMQESSKKPIRSTNSNKTSRSRRSNEITFGNFPTEIYYEIFKSLNGEQLRKCATVCKKWKNIVQTILNIDCVFICDITKSVKEYWGDLLYELEIQTVIFDKIKYGFIGYTDHYSCNKLITSVPLTYDSFNLMGKLYNVELGEGRDYPEAVLDGLYASLHLNWRPYSKKICILICDSPAHGVRYSSKDFIYDDNFPDGCPCGLSENFIFSEFTEMNIIFFILYTHPNVESMCEKLSETYPNVVSIEVKQNKFREVIPLILSKIQ